MRLLPFLLLLALPGSSPGSAQVTFRPLFDGSTLDGWMGGSTHAPDAITPEQQAAWDAEVPEHWRVEDGELVSNGAGPHLVTREEFGDFEMTVEWKIQAGGDSGIYLRGMPQVQIWDPSSEEARKHGAEKGSGGLWNNQQGERFPLVVADHPIGEWNRMLIRMVGARVNVWLNGKVVVRDVVLENYFDRTRPVPARGTIHLQTHGGETRFRRLRVREIGSEEANRLLADAAAARLPDRPFESLFDGKSLTGWFGALDDYEVVKGSIRCKPGRGGNLLTEAVFGDFALQLEFALPPGGNNGLAIRVPGADVDAAYHGIELQVLDDTAEKFRNLKPYQYHGSAYGLAAAHRGYQRPVGVWNFQEIRVQGDHVTVELNGFPILDVDLAEARRTPIDGQPHPGAARTEGHFGFCGHNDPVAFRRIQARKL